MRNDCHTLVFRYDTPEQRQALMDLVKPYWSATEGLRVVAISVDNEVTRAGLMADALDRYSDGYELRGAIEALAECDDLRKWDWNFETEE